MPIVRNCPTCGKANRIPAKHLSDAGRCGACKAVLAALAEPVEVGTAEFDDIIRESKVPVLKVDTEAHPDLAARYRVQGIPNFAVFVRGDLQFQQAGLVDANTMKEWLAKAWFLQT